jgi:hypothetical protein
MSFFLSFKKNTLFIALSGLIHLLPAQTIKNILFVGNSYTSYNNLPNLTREIGLKHGDTFTVAQRSPGGYTFRKHTTTADFFQQLRTGNYDAVILQEQSQIPSFPLSQVEWECFPYAKQLCDSIRAINPKTKIVFYMTWGRRDGDAQNCAFNPPVCTFDGMNNVLRERYISMAQQNSCRVAPVGAVWRDLRDSTTLNLYDNDGSHPSATGSLTAAMVIYRTLFEKPLKTDFSLMSFPAKTISQLSNTTNSIVKDSASLWNYEHQLKSLHAFASHSKEITCQKITSLENKINITSKPHETWKLFTINGLEQKAHVITSTPYFLEITPDELTPGLYILISSEHQRKLIWIE